MKPLAVTLGTLGMFVLATHAGDAHAVTKKPAAKTAKGATKVPLASAAEIERLKFGFKWGMTPDDVAGKLTERIEASYQDRLQKYAADPTRYDRLQKQLRGELEGVKKNLVKFDGQKSGYDVSIIDQEFGQKTNESMLIAKEETATRYFFFHDERLYKMFVAFDKEILKGKSFDEFSKLMQARFGKAAAGFVDVAVRGGMDRKLDHYSWSSGGGDGLRLVDRSEFYDVYCLALYDARVAGDLTAARRAANPVADKRDSLVDAVTTTGAAGDSNDNVIDRIVGTTVHKPGEGPQHADIVVPRTAPAQGAKTPSGGSRPEAKKGLEP